MIDRIPSPRQDEVSTPPGRPLVLAAVLALILGIYVRTFLVQAFQVPSRSMEPGLLVGDHILVNKFIYGDSRASGRPWLPWLPRRDLQRGDVVVLVSPRQEQFLIKRCIGLPGDTLEASQGSLVVNRRRVDEGYLKRRGPTRAMSPRTIPLDRYFFLGDHRTASVDSREWGALSDDHVVGQGFLIYWSKEGSDDREPDTLDPYSRDRFSWLQRVRWERFMKPIR